MFYQNAEWMCPIHVKSDATGRNNEQINWNYLSLKTGKLKRQA